MPLVYQPTPLDFVRIDSAEMERRASAFTQRIQTRRSVRDFSDEPVPRALIEQALRAAGTAPSGANQQPWTFVAVSDPGLKRQIREGAEEEERAFYADRAPDVWLDALAHLGTDEDKAYLETVPWIVVMFAQSYGLDEDGNKTKHYYVPESCGIAAGFFIAAIHEMGLATLTHTPSPMRFLGEILGRPAHERPFLLLPVGYPAPRAEVPTITKKPLDEFVVWK